MSGERFTLDTNILVYSVDTLAGARHAMAAEIVERAVGRDCRLTLQAVSEFYVVASRKGMVPASEAAAQANDWLILFPCIPASASAIRAALAAAASGRASYWDALLVATAAEGGCRTVLTEDLKDGGELAGVGVHNPFAAEGRLSDMARKLLGA